LPFQVLLVEIELSHAVQVRERVQFSVDDFAAGGIYGSYLRPAVALPDDEDRRRGELGIS
jgi:hypothetical protein